MSDTDDITFKPKPTTKRPRKMAREPKAEATAPGDNVAAAFTKQTSKTDLVLELLRRPDGSTNEQLVGATGWLPHTTRAALTGLKKKGHVVTSDKIEGRGRVYRVMVAG